MLQVHLATPRGRPTMMVAGELNIYSVAEARQALRAVLDMTPPPEIDLSGVEEMDTAGAQLLVWLKREAHATGQVLTFTGHSPAVVDALDLLHLAAVLGDPILITPQGRT